VLWLAGTDRRYLPEQFELAGVVLNVVGVASVGTCIRQLRD
jgi:hypothetical protein